MKKLLVVIIISIFLSGPVFAQDPYPNPYPNPYPDPIPNPFPNPFPSHGHDTYTQPYKHDAYGPGVHSDSTGKPFEWKTQDGQKSQGKIKIDAYGLGVGMDEFGRPVKPSPWGK